MQRWIAGAGILLFLLAFTALILNEDELAFRHQVSGLLMLILACVWPLKKGAA